MREKSDAARTGRRGRLLRLVAGPNNHHDTMTLDEPVNDAAARALIADRCQRAYVHDIRGGLQALSGALELLERLARGGDGDAGVVERASSLARRALANHETAMIDLVKQVTAADEPVEPIEIGGLLEDVLRFLRTDIAARQLTVRTERGRAQTARVDAARNQLRFLLLGLLTLWIDTSDPGSVLCAQLATRDGWAVLELDAASGRERSGLEADLVLGLVQHRADAHGGRLERPGGGVLRLSLPLRRESEGQGVVT